jgi:sterol desaturase/sphingolipid hydroxylase (fatty acid hydroxylase superfamily)
MSSVSNFKSYKREQAALSRSLLLPVTFFYTAISVLMIVLAARSAHPFVAVPFYLLGVPVWTFVEYITHRYILHANYNPGKFFLRRIFVEKINPLHWGHHEQPFDGEHINGELQDLLPLFAFAAPISFIFPIYTAPMLLIGVAQAYVLEEWVHHCVHYYNFRNPYFRYIRKHHIYHHTSNGMELGYGFTSAIWDNVFGTRYSAAVRRRLYGRSLRANLRWRPRRTEPLNVVQETFQP